MTTEGPQFSPRPMTEDDLEQVLAIERASSPAPWTADHFRSEWDKSHSRSLVLTDDETDEQVVGFIVFWCLGHQGHILEVATHPEHRRRGLGKRLVQLAVQHALREQMQEILLEVRTSNDAAVRLYQSNSFDIRQIRRRFYSNGEDAYVMNLSLSGTVSNF